MKCSFHNSEIIKIIDHGFIDDNGNPQKQEVPVVCDGQWHKRGSVINRNGRLLGEAIVCMCPEYQEFWRDHLSRAATTQAEKDRAKNWTHSSLKERRY